MRQYRRETARFVADCVSALRAAGLDVTEVRQDAACLRPGPVWLNLPVWFHRRGDPGQRFSSLGAYLVRFKRPALDELELVQDWTIP